MNQRRWLYYFIALSGIFMYLYCSRGIEGEGIDVVVDSGNDIGEDIFKDIELRTGVQRRSWMWEL